MSKKNESAAAPATQAGKGSLLALHVWMSDQDYNEPPAYEGYTAQEADYFTTIGDTPLIAFWLDKEMTSHIVLNYSQVKTAITRPVPADEVAA